MLEPSALAQAIEPDLQSAIERWPDLPEMLKAGIVAVCRRWMQD